MTDHSTARALVEELERRRLRTPQTEYGRGWNCGLEEAQDVVRARPSLQPEGDTLSGDIEWLRRVRSTCAPLAQDRVDRILAALQSRGEALEKCESDNAKLLGWLYEACDGFPVSQEAMDAVSRDVETLEAIRDCSDGDGISLGEFRQKVLAKIDAALSASRMSEEP